MDGVTRRSRAASASSAPQSAPVEQSPVTPVKSAKDVINAMYAADPSKRLSQYLATSAKDIINASADNKASGSRSAASLHHSSSQRRLKSVRPSASAIFNNSATDESTVVRTSLKLKPQKATSSRSTRKKISLDDAISELASSSQPQPSPQPTQSAPRSAPSTQPVARSARPIDQVRPAQPDITRTAPAPSPQPSQPSPRTQSSSARPAAGHRFMQDVIRSPRATTPSGQPAQASRPISDINVNASVSNPASAQASRPRVARPPHSSRPANSLDGTLARPRAPHSPQGTATAPHTPQNSSSTVNSASSTANIASAINAANAAVNAMTDATAAPDATKPKTKSRSIESIKNRFRPKNKNTDRPKKHRAEDFLQPSYTDAPSTPTDTPTNTANTSVNVANAPANAPINVEPPKEAVHIYGMSPEPEQPTAAPTWVQADQASPAGEVELGVIEDFSPNSVPTSADSAETAKVTPHGPDVLGGDSPFFLKSVSVEKRPLSDAPPRRNPQAEGATRVAPSFNSTNPASFANLSSLTNLEDSAPDPQPETTKKDKKSKAKSTKSAKTPKNAKSPKPAKSAKSAKPAKAPKSSKSAKSSRRDLEPTVIIPQHSGSHTTIIVLLIFTIIIGALVGAATYLFLFQ